MTGWTYPISSFSNTRESRDDELDELLSKWVRERCPNYFWEPVGLEIRLERPKLKNFVISEVKPFRIRIVWSKNPLTISFYGSHAKIKYILTRNMFISPYKHTNTDPTTNQLNDY